MHFTRTISSVKTKSNQFHSRQHTKLLILMAVAYSSIRRIRHSTKRIIMFGPRDHWPKNCSLTLRLMLPVWGRFFTDFSDFTKSLLKTHERPILRLFMDKLEGFKWGIFESAITKSRLTYEPKVKTCFTCLRTRPVDDFSATKQKKSISHCKSCDRTGYRGKALKSYQWKTVFQNHMMRITTN